MEILFVIPTMKLGGAEKSLCSLLNSLSEKEDCISLLVFTKEGELLSDIPKNVDFYGLDCSERAMVLEWRYYYKDLLHFKDLAKLVRRFAVLIIDQIQRFVHVQRIDTWRIISPSIKRFPKKFDLAIGYLEGTADFYALEKVDAKYKIGWIHTDINVNKKNIQKERKYYDQFNRIITISDICKQSIIQQMPELADRVDVVPNISNATRIYKLAEEFTPYDDSLDVCNIVTVSRLEYEKGIDISIEVASVLRKKGFKFQWYVYGAGTKKALLLQKIKAEGLDDVFHLQGTVTNPYPYMKASNIIVQTSRYEGKSVVIDEAKILEKPIVITNYPSAKDQIIDGKTGLICDYNPDHIAESIIHVYTDEKTRDVLQDNLKRENAIRGDDLKAFTEALKRIQ